MQKFFHRISWCKNRIQSMSMQEIWYRLEEQFKRVVSRFYKPSFLAAVSDELPLPNLPGLAEGLQVLEDKDWLLHQWHEVESRAAQGRIVLLGMEWPGPKLNRLWHTDPVTGKHWPADVYCFDVRYRDVSGLGDVKYIWELNRLQYLQPISALTALEHDTELARACVRDLESWIDANPPFKGVNWTSGIELALRIISILVVTSFLGSGPFTKAQRRKLLAALAAHGYWLMRYPSKFSSSNNHLIAEAGGLFLLGTLAPQLPHAAEWANYGQRTLIEEVSKQIYPDGVGVEQSPTYAAFTIEWLLLCGEVANRIGRPFPELYWQRIELAGSFLRWLTDVAGNQPRIGDDDEGQVFFSHVAPESYINSVLACIASATGRVELSPPRIIPHLRHAYFPIPEPLQNGPMGIRHLDKGGYTVARSIENGAECLILFDHGPIGYLSIAAHGHADALAVWLHVDGRPVLVDAGTYLYHSGGSWRDHFRGTPAHNTLSVKGRDSSLISGAFNWSNKADVRVLAFNSDPANWSIEAEHDGFMAAFGVYHRRRVERIGNGEFAITDSLHDAAVGLPVEVGFLLHPELNIYRSGTSWIVRDGGRPLLAIDYQGVLAGSLQRGQREPPRGWYSGSFGHKVATSRLIFSGKFAVGTSCRFVLRILPEA